MSCQSCGRYSHKGPGVCDSCKSIQEYNKPALPKPQQQIQQGSSSGMFKPQWQIEAERMQMVEAQRRAQAAEQERREMDLQRILGGAGVDIDQIYRRMYSGRGGPSQRDYSGKPKKIMIMKIV